MHIHFPGVSRRNFLATTGGLSAALLAGTRTAPAEEIIHSSQPRRLLKTLKIGMVKSEGNLTEKFKIAKQAGFEGIELNSPGIDIAQTKQAIADSGLVVDGSVCATHWRDHHSAADSSVRAKAVADLKTAITETHAVGGHTVLLVVGHGDDGPETEIWPRSIANIRQALPLCAELGMTIAIENVWNKFLYEDEGPNDQSAEKFVRYVDEFNSPWVGMQFDIGNHWKYGNPADWIRQLGKRMVKLDVKGSYAAGPLGGYYRR